MTLLSALSLSLESISVRFILSSLRSLLTLTKPNPVVNLQSWQQLCVAAWQGAPHLNNNILQYITILLVDWAQPGGSGRDSCSCGQIAAGAGVIWKLSWATHPRWCTRGTAVIVAFGLGTQHGFLTTESKCGLSMGLGFTLWGSGFRNRVFYGWPFQETSSRSCQATYVIFLEQVEAHSSVF